MTAQKKIVIIAGPNGAGKTTFAREFLPEVLWYREPSSRRA
jgi:ABC-type Mn2+/Zn2+ transport system ATPase subunit